MQGSPETIDPQLLILSNSRLLSPALCEQQDVSHDASANPRHGFCDTHSDVEEESVGEQASTDREYEWRDSDELEMLGHFDFGSFPEPSARLSMPVVTEGFAWPISERYMDSTSLSQSVYDEPWTHIRATASDKVASNPNSWKYPPSGMVLARDNGTVNLLNRQGMLPIHRSSNGAEAACCSLAPGTIHDPPTPPQDLTRYSGHQFSHEKMNSNTTALDELSPPYTQSSIDGSPYQGRISQELQPSDRRVTVYQSDPSFDQPWSFYDGGETVGPHIHGSFPGDRATLAGFQVTMRNEVQQRTQAIPIRKDNRSSMSRQHKRSSDSGNGELAFAAQGQLSLEVVEEDGQGNVNHCGGLLKRGIRIGPLPKEQALQVAETRKEQKVCMKCRENRSQCAGGLPCQRCKRLSVSGMLAQPCLKAQFLDIVKAGSCNYISQRAINHLTLDNTRRVQMFLPETFKLGELLSLLESRRNRYRIKARQQSGPLYTLDLDKCHRFLTIVCAKQGREEFDLRDFIDNKLLGTSEWLNCVSGYRDENGIVALLSQWGNMPSRASYTIQPLDGSAERDMDVEDAKDHADILIAAQLSRIICRKLEIDGYKALQCAINKLRFKTSAEVHKFVHELGQLLVTLRWRLSWWELLGDGSNKDFFRDRFVERVREFSKVLYFYFFTVKRRLGSWSEAHSDLEGMMSFYADAIPVFDDFPVSESIDGFQTWMAQGKVLLYQAGVVQKLAQRSSLSDDNSFRRVN